MRLGAPCGLGCHAAQVPCGSGYQIASCAIRPTVVLASTTHRRQSCCRSEVLASSRMLTVCIHGQTVVLASTTHRRQSYADLRFSRPLALLTIYDTLFASLVGSIRLRLVAPWTRMPCGYALRLGCLTAWSALQLGVPCGLQCHLVPKWDAMRLRCLAAMDTVRLFVPCGYLCRAAMCAVRLTGSQSFAAHSLNAKC